MGDVNLTHKLLTGGYSMLKEIECFVNWLRRRNPKARAWRDYRYDLEQYAQEPCEANVSRTVLKQRRG